MHEIDCFVRFEQSRFSPWNAAEAVVEIAGGEIITGLFESDFPPAETKRRAVQDLVAKLRARGLEGKLRIIDEGKTNE